MKKGIYLPISGVVAGELLMYFGHADIGLGIYIINLQVIILTLIFSNLPSETKNALQSVVLLLLLRIVSLSMPQFFSTILPWYLLVYGLMFLPVYIIIKNQSISSKELGINFNRLLIYLPSALLIGVIIAALEYRVLKPAPLIESIAFPNMALIAIVMFIFVGAVEELIFRSILQTRLESVFGLRYGLLLSGGIFGIMHANYGVVNEILIAGFIGVILGYIFQRTRSLPFIVAVHGTANILLFGILPIVFA